MRQTLHAHPGTPAAALSGIAVAAERCGDLVLTYCLDGAPASVTPSLLGAATRRRADELWRHTCLEAFVKPAGGEAYWEFNLAPSLDWQVYAFDFYRRGRQPVAIEPPAVASRHGKRGWEMAVRWPLAGLVPAGLWRLALAAVIEEVDGAVSYWALRHAPGKPDFHHPDAFALELTERP